jgi:hypothetical protein
MKPTTLIINGIIAFVGYYIGQKFIVPAIKPMIGG